MDADPQPLLPRKPRRRHHNPGEQRGLLGRVIAFTPRARVALERPWATGIFCVLLVGASYFCYNALGSDLLPAMDEGGFILDYIAPPGSSLADTNRLLNQVQKILQDTPEVENTSRRTGLQLGLAAVTEANTGDFTVKLKRQRSRGVEEVIADVRKRVTTEVPTLDVEFAQLLQDMIGDLTSAPEPVVIKMFSQNPDLLRQWGPRVGDAIKKIHGVVDVQNGIENTISGPAMEFHVDPTVAARSGFSPDEVELDASAILQGEPASAPVVVNGRAYTIRVRFPEYTRASVEAIRNTLLSSQTGSRATLGSLATVEELPGQTEIRRENLQRMLAVTARLEGLNLGAGIQAVKKTVADLNIPPEYPHRLRRRLRGAAELVPRSGGGVDTGGVLVFIVLLFEFGDFGAPLAILSSALLSTSGVFLALLVTGTTFNISSFMGLIMVIGIVAKNGILLLDADQKFRAEGARA